MTDKTNSGPMPSFLDRGLGMLFGTSGQKKGMAPPPIKPLAQAKPITAPKTAPPLDLNSPQNINTMVDDMVSGK